MRQAFLLVLVAVLAGCGADPGPAEVAAEFHALRVAGDDRAVYAMLTEADRSAIAPEAFPTELPTPMMLALLGWGDARLDTAALLGTGGDTARVALHMVGGEVDTLRLVALRRTETVAWLFDRDRVDWRVSIQLDAWSRLDSLATAVNPDASATDSAAVARAADYLEAARRQPELARPADVDAARSLMQAAAVARGLDIALRRAEAVSGTPFIEGHVTNPSERRINTLRLVVRDAAGEEETLELWDIAPGERVSVWRITRLGRGPLVHEVDAIRVF